ncbi:CPBP family intramembrane glutamic endopeptidase [Pseudoduganella violaceinigra]|uniref:CPBP family intramembrane glutamic endopeptidase n=1 Tax=Pseudoduganella violaceinigra TaxID=246602 RepID=UPI00040EAC84|nr:CPBP family intramembrane glutamic endopeptidase [Pseudoduganella violaceinigra]
MELPGAHRAFWLIARLRLLRLLNIAGGLPLRRVRPGAGRAATPGKKKARWLLSGTLTAFMLFAFLNTASTSLLNMQCRLPTGSQCTAADSDRAPRAAMSRARVELQAAPFHPVLMQAAAMQAVLLFAIAILLPLGSSELAQPDWDLEWLVTLPLRRRTLLLARIAERTLANPSGILALWPMCLAVAWHSGHRWSAPLLAAACTLLLLACAATLRTVADTGLRLRLAPSQLRNLQALASIASMPLMYLAMSLAMPTSTLTLAWASHFPAWTLWTPPGLALQALNARHTVQALGLGALLAAQTALLLWLGLRLLQALLAGGVVVSGSRETRRAAPARQIFAGWVPGTPLQRRDLRLLSRDRNFLVQSLLLPLIIVGCQLVLDSKVNTITEFVGNAALFSSVAFGLGAYVLMLSAFQTIHSEGQALWLLYTYPQSLAAMLAEKAQLWSLLAMLYPLAIFAFGVCFGLPFNGRMLSQLLLVMAGLPIFAVIAVSLGIWACDPLAQQTHARMRPTLAFAYLMLTTLYTYALSTRTWHLRLAAIVLLVSLALSLWQRARDSLPYLLDPSAVPPPRVSASDGFLAAVAIFLLQLLLGFALQRPGTPASLLQQTVVAIVPGALVYGLTLLLYRRFGTSGVPRLWQGPWCAAWRSAVGWGLLMALPAVATSILWGAFPGRANLIQDSPHPASWLWVAALAILASPVFEEFIFRGLMFGGLRRSLPLLPAMLSSAALFAVIHPPLAMAPVFVVGLCTAYAAERSKSLLAPILVHALYNAAVHLL